MDVTLAAWAATIGLIGLLLAIDFAVAILRPHAVGMREATVWSLFYVAVALAFGAVVWAVYGQDAGTEYLAGWVVEKSLSVDNLFVFVIIMSRFAVPVEYEQKALLFGITLALIMRAVFIAVGAAALGLFSFTFVIFGLVLIWTAVQLARHRNEDPDPGDNLLLRGVRRFVPTTDTPRDGKLFLRENGRLTVTPLFLVFLAIGSTDLLFALDSIPAVFGITQEAFLVFAANAFALLGLRALYFLIEGLLERLVYLSIGLSIILAFIGAKLILVFLHEDISTSFPTVPTPVSLGVILVVLAITTVASLMRTKTHPEERAHAGSLRGPRRETIEPAKQSGPARVAEPTDKTKRTE